MRRLLPALQPNNQTNNRTNNYPIIVPLQIFCWTYWTFEIWRSAIVTVSYSHTITVYQCHTVPVWKCHIVQTECDKYFGIQLLFQQLDWMVLLLLGIVHFCECKYYMCMWIVGPNTGPNNFIKEFNYSERLRILFEWKPHYNTMPIIYMLGEILDLVFQFKDFQLFISWRWPLLCHIMQYLTLCSHLQKSNPNDHNSWTFGLTSYNKLL